FPKLWFKHLSSVLYKKSRDLPFPCARILVVTTLIVPVRQYRLLNAYIHFHDTEVCQNAVQCYFPPDSSPGEVYLLYCVIRQCLPESWICLVLTLCHPRYT